MHLLLTVLEAEVQGQVPARLDSRGRLLLAPRSESRDWWGWGWGLSFYEGANLVTGTPPHDLITSQGPICKCHHIRASADEFQGRQTCSPEHIPRTLDPKSLDITMVQPNWKPSADGPVQTGSLWEATRSRHPVTQSHSPLWPEYLLRTNWPLACTDRAQYGRPKASLHPS